LNQIKILEKKLFPVKKNELQHFLLASGHILKNGEMNQK
jgi:hypothetical protein